eukprot:scaffold3548_cov79-Skeletonema_dohrnii-CCMP3373.AAC.5
MVSSIVNGVLGKVAPPAPLVFVSQGWPSFLLSAMAMNLPIAGAYFPRSLHRYFDKTKSGNSTWYTPLDFQKSPTDGILVVTGTLSFILEHSRACRPSIVCVEEALRSTSPKTLKTRGSRARSDLEAKGYTTFVFKHALFGGATSASHLVGIDTELMPSHSLEDAPRDVPRSLSHFLNSASTGNFTPRWIDAPRDVAILPVSTAKVSWLDRPTGMNQDVLDSNGLLPVSSPYSLVGCPSVFCTNDKLCARSITAAEALRIYSIPTFMDQVLLPSIPTVRHRLPFEDAVSPEITGYIFRRLWEIRSGGESYDGRRDSVPEPQGVEEEKLSVLEEEADLVERAQPLMEDFSEGREDSSLDGEDLLVDEKDVVLSEYSPSLTCDVRDSNDIQIQSEMTSNIEIEIDDDKTVITNNLTSQRNAVGEEGSDKEVVLPLGKRGFDKEDALKGRQIAEVELPDSTLLHPAFSAPSESLEAASAALHVSKAVKADDAEVPTHIWDERVFKNDLKPSSDAQKEAAVATLRRFGLGIYWKNLLGDCRERLRTNFGQKWYNKSRSKHGKATELAVEVNALANVMWHATEADWFEYKRGSQIHYFRFPPIYQKMARDGVKVFFEKKGPSSKRRQRTIDDPELRKKVRKKLEKVIDRGYIVEAGISLKSLIKYFPVPKGEDDIRMVYDATANELNEAVWCPSFWLPTVESMIRALDCNSFMLDRDIGEHFLNMPLHKSVWAYTGLDLGPVFDDDENASDDAPKRWFHWVRCLMGFKSSPYIAVKMTLIVEEMARGDRHDVDNPFHWAAIRQNLPGTPDYTPTKPWISKMREDGRVAADLFTFVDDERVTGPDEELTWQAGHRLACIQSYLGIQDAARKVRRCSQTPGAWAGAVVHILAEYGVCILTSPEKWNKLKSILTKWLGRLESGEEKLDHKELLSDRGFLVYVTKVYPSMIPYLKGFHLTIENWRGDRDEEGWKLKSSKLRTATPLEDIEVDDYDDESVLFDQHRQEKCVEGNKEDDEGEGYLNAPPDGKTTAVPRFRSDLLALLELSNYELPPLRLVRGKVVFTALYGFGDASGKGFGSTSSHANGEVSFRLGIWGRDEEGESSNYRELRNLVEAAEEEARKGNLSNTEFWLFTDNITAEACFHRGNSSSKLLHGLILRLRMLEVQQSVVIHVVHVSGKRMIAQGTDGVSRSSRLEGVMVGEDMLSFIPLAETAIERHPSLLSWVASWSGINDIKPLGVEDWFDKGHGVIGGAPAPSSRGIWIPEHEAPGQVHLWAPPPALADVALEELLKARHKRTDTYHIMLIPRVMTPRWRRLFNKAMATRQSTAVGGNGKEIASSAP